jgi:hypothetical protein
LHRQAAPEEAYLRMMDDAARRATNRKTIGDPATVRIATVTLRDHSGRLTGEVKHRR